MIIHAIVRFLILAFAVFLIAKVLPGVRIRSFRTALAVSAVYGLLNFLLFRVLIIFTFPLIILKWVTLGIFGIILNAVLLMITDKLLDDFELSGFGSALLAAIGIAAVNLLLGMVLS